MIPSSIYDLLIFKSTSPTSLGNNDLEFEIKPQSTLSLSLYLQPVIQGRQAIVTQWVLTAFFLGMERL